MINYSNIAKAVELYEGLGYKYIDVPWWVTQDIMNVTKPTGVGDDNVYKLSINGKCLVASGEQAFLYLACKGQLAPGLYQTVTPCFRNEVHDRYHSKHFMKLELIKLCSDDHNVVQQDVNEIAGHANDVMLTLANWPSGAPIFPVRTHVTDPIEVAGTHQLDLALYLGRDIELGSYGARRTSFATWIYGTGIAEPRFSNAMRELVYKK